MKRKNYFLILVIIAILQSCSDFDEQDFTVLLPDAGEDLVIFTAKDGNAIHLNGSNSVDVNNIGFEYKWELINSPNDASFSLTDSNTATPTLNLNKEISGRYELSLIISRGEQQARDFINIDVNPVFAQILFVNGIDANNDASLSIPSIELNGHPVPPLNPDNTYYNIDLNLASNTDDAVLLQVDYNGTKLELQHIFKPLESYTLYLVGAEENPELILIQKTRNQNTIPATLVGLGVINLAPNTNDVELYIDATSVGYDILPIDILFTGFGIPESFGLNDYKGNSEIYFPSNSLIPLPIWATVNGQRISNDSNITLNEEGNFGTFILYPDANSEFGYTLNFINNSELLPE